MGRRGVVTTLEMGDTKEFIDRVFTERALYTGGRVIPRCVTIHEAMYRGCNSVPVIHPKTLVRSVVSLADMAVQWTHTANHKDRTYYATMPDWEHMYGSHSLVTRYIDNDSMSFRRRLMLHSKL